MGEKSQPRVAKTTTKKLATSKRLFARFSLVLLAFIFFLLCTALFLLQPSSSATSMDLASRVGCLSRKFNKVRLQELVEDNQDEIPKRRNLTKVKIPSFMKDITGENRRLKIGMVNMEDWDITEWNKHAETIQIYFDRVPETLQWQDLFPEWINEEEEETNPPVCPEIPMPDFSGLKNHLDVVVAELPCRFPEKGWNREVLRLQVHLVVAKLAAKIGRRDWERRTKVVVWSKCRPMMEIFCCDDLAVVEGGWWFFQPEAARLLQKAELPVGSCRLALPLLRGHVIDKVHGERRLRGGTTRTPPREAYTTVLHSSEAYVCGAITLAQSLLQTGTKRELILLLDTSISVSKRQALSTAGWKIRLINRIRNPNSQRKTYNEYNYSKLRLWQLTEYDKIVFIDSDIVVLRDLDPLFNLPQISAAGNDLWIFNSGIMVIEPSNCTFRTIMSLRHKIVSYNGGDQGFLNEIFVWWHRLPKRFNFMKVSWSNSSSELDQKNRLFAADPPELYAIHYLGWKPWSCYRDYDCNFDSAGQRVYGNDAAHARWWRVHDLMEERLQRECRLTTRWRKMLDRERKKAWLKGSFDGHWRINITDPRRLNLQN